MRSPNVNERHIRVMVEAQTETLAEFYVQQIRDVVEEEIGVGALV